MDRKIDKSRFFSLLNRSAKPLSEDEGKHAGRTSGGYTDKRTRPNKRGASEKKR